MFAMVSVLAAGFALAVRDVQAWECVKNQPCFVQLSVDNVTADDQVLLAEMNSAEAGCPACIRSRHGLCPWLDGDSGISETVACEDGSYSASWSCQLEGRGDRVLCPPNDTLCADRSCGGGLDFCCDALPPPGVAKCELTGGSRVCPYVAMTPDMKLIINKTHGSLSPGPYALCRCSAADFAKTSAGRMLGELRIQGPGPKHKQTCLAGSKACFAQFTDGLDVSAKTSLVQVTPADTCDSVEANTPESFVENFRFRWREEWSGAYLISYSTGRINRKWQAAQNPGVYTLCWCNNVTQGACERLQDFNVSAGQLTWRGPFKQEGLPRMVTIGQEFELQVSGVWITTKSMVGIRRHCDESADASFLEARAAPSGAALSYNFGMIAEDRLPPGRYFACWCQPNYWDPPLTCLLASDFVTQVAEILVRCPPGQYSPDGGACASCAFFWQEPNRWRDDCNVEAMAVGLAVAVFLCYLSGWVVLWYQLGFLVEEAGGRCTGLSGRKVHIEDISSSLSQSGEWTAAIKTVQEHSLSARFGAFPIYFYQTGHYLLDRRPEHRAFLYQARPVGPCRLQLLDAQGKPVQNADTSRGYFVLRFTRSVLHSDVRPGVPVAVLAPVLLLCAFPLLIVVAWESEPQNSVWVGSGAVLAGCALGFVIARILKYWRQRWSPIHESLARFRRKLKDRNPNPVACNRGPDRALTAYQIFDLMHDFRPYIRDRNLYYIDSNIVHPLTSNVKLSLAELLGPSRVQYFVSHYWGTMFTYTCDALRRHAENVTSGQKDVSWQSVSYWICAFSNNQYQIATELGASHQESSFYLALHSPCVQGTCMILDEKALPLTRSWCLFELLQTVNLENRRKDFQGLQFCTNTGIVNLGQTTTEVAINIGKRLAELSLADAEATRATDQETIRSLVVQDMGSFGEMDNILNMKIKDALVVCKKCTVEDFNRLFALLDELCQKKSES